MADEANTVATGYIQLMPSLKGMKATLEKELKGAVETPLARESERAGATSGKALGAAIQRELQTSTAGMARTLAQQTQQATGGIVASLKAAVAQYGGGKAVLAGLATQASSATQQLSGLVHGSAELGTATGGLKAGLLGVSGLLGGPWGIAIGGGALALNAFAQAQQDADDRTKAFLDTLDRQTGKVTADSAAKAARGILDALGGADQANLERLGISVQDATKAVLDGGDAFAQYRSQIEQVGSEYVRTHPLTDQTAQAIRHLLQVLDVQHGALGNSQSDWSKNSAAQKIATAIAGQLTGQTDALGSSLRAASGEYTVQITTNMAAVINQAKAMLSLLARMGGGGAQYSAGAALQDYIRSIESGATKDPITAAQEAAKKVKAKVSHSSGGGGRRTSSSSSGNSARASLLELIGGSFAADLAGSDRAGIGRTGSSLAAAAAKALSGSRETTVTALIRKDTTALQALAGKRSTVAKRLEDAQRSLDALQSAKASTVASATAAGMGNLVGARSSSGVLRVLNKQLATVTRFRSNLTLLAKRGLPTAFLQQLVNAGLDGAMTAAALARSSDSDFTAITAVTNALSAQSSGLGQDAGTLLYQPGIDSIQGLVKGIQSQQSAVDKAMLNIAKSMQEAIKKALGIHSPSQVFRDLGRQVPAGFGLGVLDGTPAAHKYIRALASSGVGLGNVSGSVAPEGGGLGGPVHVQIDQHGMDPHAAATAIANELVWRNKR